MSSPEEVMLNTLIVENNANFRRVLKINLQDLFPSMVIHEAAEGNEALQRVDTFRPELIFMDIGLPGENGLQLTQRIKTSYPDTKVIILTSHDTLEYREAAIRCGANCFITKASLNWEQLETLVKSLVK
jgi:DNA-binding NarL/FixJ family response regulator